MNAVVKTTRRTSGESFIGLTGLTMTSLYLGIDTGGTFTDGVLLDSERQMVVKTGKVLTTHHDLRICISQILDLMLPDEPSVIRLVSLSTTLATNAIVEGKSRPVGLFLVGYDPALVRQYDFHRQFGTDHYFYIEGGMDLQGHEVAPLDEVSLLEQAKKLNGQVEAYAVSCYGGPFNSSHEERAGETIASLTGLPVVQGHHLSGRLDSIRRATTASLNAALLSTAYDFLNTVQTMLTQRNVHCPLVIVRGDGSLVSAEFAARRPVEIIHSGPATSAIGGLYLAGVDSALVIDMGGTTTDLGLLRGGRAVIDGGEATVGGYRTSVSTIRARSFGLGGDSEIRFDPRGHLRVGPNRVMPLAYLAHTYPEAVRDLEAWLMTRPTSFYSDRLEYWVLRREPRQPFNDPRTNRVIELLRDGPRRLPWLLKQVGVKSARQVDGDLLVRQDIITRAGLTPTDLLHASGEFAPWNQALPRLVIDSAAHMLHLDAEQLIRAVRREMTSMIVAEIVHFISGHPVPEPSESYKKSSLARWLFDENLDPTDPDLGCQLRLKIPLVGIGAPARAFLPPVAEALNTTILFPDYYEVANAVGTVVGNILVEKKAEVVPLVNGTVRVGYRVLAGAVQRTFDKIDEALVFARASIVEQARAEAESAGARDPRIETNEQSLIGEIYLLSACAVSKPG